MHENVCARMEWRVSAGYSLLWFLQQISIARVFPTLWSTRLFIHRLFTSLNRLLCTRRIQFLLSIHPHTHTYLSISIFWFSPAGESPAQSRLSITALAVFFESASAGQSLSVFFSHASNCWCVCFYCRCHPGGMLTGSCLSAARNKSTGGQLEIFSGIQTTMNLLHSLEF